jgi:hypothetical protein
MCVLASARMFSVICVECARTNSVGGAPSIRNGRPLGQISSDNWLVLESDSGIVSATSSGRLLRQLPTFPCLMPPPPRASKRNSALGTEILLDYFVGEALITRFHGVVCCVHEIFLWVLVRGSVSGTGRKLKCEIRQPASGRTRGAASNMTQRFQCIRNR